MKKVLASFAANSVFANIVLVMVMLVGWLALEKMPRESFPQFSTDLISVTVPYPGADPEEVEEGICAKLEERLETIQGIKRYTTTATEHRASAIIEVQEKYQPREVLGRVKTEIDAISTFPIDAEKPVAAELLINDSVMLLTFSGQLTEKQLVKKAAEIREDLKQLPHISQVQVFGNREYEISIELSKQQLRRYQLTIQQVTAAIQQASLNLAGGVLRTENEEIRVRTVGRKYTGAELAEIVVLATETGILIRLGELATIRDDFVEKSIQATVDEQRAVFIMVFKTPEEDGLKIADAVKGYLVTQQQILPPGASLELFYDNTQSLRARINLLTRNGMIGMSLVFFLLWLFLDPRLSFWAGMGIPISMAGGLILLWLSGNSINMISLFGFIMVMGIVVDDAIVVGESIYVHRMAGKPPLLAAVEGVEEVAKPVLAAVLTSIIAFIPLSQVGGVMGKFIAILPTVVIVCLMISLVECLLLLPAHLGHLPDLQHLKQAPKNRWRHPLRSWQYGVRTGLDWFIERIYLPVLMGCLHWRYIAMSLAVAVLLLTLGMVKGGLIKFDVFPKIDGFVVTATVTFPEGTPVQETENALAEMEAAFLRVAARHTTKSGAPMIEKRLRLTGQTLRTHQSRTGTHLGSTQIILLPSEQRGIHTSVLLAEWEEELGEVPGAQSLKFEGLSTGPGGADLEIWLQGQALPDLLLAAEALQEKLKTFAGVYQVSSDFQQGKNEIRLRLKPEARALGVTVDRLARQVNAGFYGSEPLRIQRGEDNIRVKVRYTAEERSQIAGFQSMRIRLASGAEVPLASVADLDFQPGFSVITRTDGLRRVVVSGEVDERVGNSGEILEALNLGYFPQLQADTPGLRVSVQGAKKNTRESFSSLQVTVPMALLAIYVIIATTFRSYCQPLVILFTIPFGIIGALGGHYLLGMTLSMMSFFGMVALTGVVVNDAIVLIERVNENLAAGQKVEIAIRNGGGRRFRAIFLTTLSTVGGLAPLILETDLQAIFLIPMALSLAAGVAFATLLTLILIPALLLILNDLRRLLYWLRQGTWPAREMVEPATMRIRMTFSKAE